MALSQDELAAHLKFVRRNSGLDDGNQPTSLLDEIKHTPLFGSEVLPHLPSDFFSQYGLIGAQESHHLGGAEVPTNQSTSTPNLVYGNHGEPSSTFICGSQGSGKSYTLSTIIENCVLTNSPVGNLPHPLPAIAFHYDPYTSLSSTQNCELAYFCSTGMKVRVLVAPSNLSAMRRLYNNLPGLPKDAPKPQVLPLKLRQEQLNVANMMTLMNVAQDKAPPLYLAVLYKLLRQMAESRPLKAGIDYIDFKRRLAAQGFQRGQTSMLRLRLQLLDDSVDQTAFDGGAPHGDQEKIWNFEPGTLTIVDLSAPFVSAGDACALFTVCLSIFMAGRSMNGRVVALDEAHKFLTQTGEAEKLTEHLISIIRQQRHLGTRVVLSTQEPTLDLRLLDLCNVVIVHRFNSPAWFNVLQDHLAGSRRAPNKEGMLDEIFRTIVSLPTGTGLLFCPTAVLHMEDAHSNGGQTTARYPSKLKDGYLKFRVRLRVTADGGRSIIASDKYELPVEDEDEKEVIITQVVQTNAMHNDQKKVTSTSSRCPSHLLSTSSITTVESTAIESLVLHQSFRTPPTRIQPFRISKAAPKPLSERIQAPPSNPAQIVEKGFMNKLETAIRKQVALRIRKCEKTGRGMVDFARVRRGACVESNEKGDKCDSGPLLKKTRMIIRESIAKTEAAWKAADVSVGDLDSTSCNL